MNKKLKNLIIIFFTFLLIIFLLNIFIKGMKINKSNITNMDILNYVPSDYRLTILSNSTENNIKRYINDNVSEKKREELNIIKDSIISYLGFDLQEKIKNIYDNEFALTFFENKSNKIDILLIFKLKENNNINDIINIGEELNKSDQIIELKRVDKINYISHIFQTKDNYLIASSNKELINSSLQSKNNHEIISSKLIPDDINLREVKLLSISKYAFPKNNSNFEPQKFYELISIINLEGNKIKLRSFSKNINKVNYKFLHNQINNIKDIILTSKYSRYKQNINFLYNDINQKEIVEEITRELNEELLFITNTNNWVICFKNILPNKNSIDQFNFLKKYKKEDLYTRNTSYSIYTNDKLKIEGDNIIYEYKNPIFSVTDEVYTYFSNNFDDLLNISQDSTLTNKYLNNNETNPYKYISNDIFFIKTINNKQLIKSYKFLKNLQYFINTELFTLEDIKININLTIPERHEKVYLESNVTIP